MEIQVLRKIALDLHCSPILTIMADETTDAPNREQVTLILRCVTNDLEVHEEFLGLYTVSTIDATTLTSVIKDLLLRTNISFEKLRGQCYDVASVMSGAKNGVAKQISDIELGAIFSHCIRVLCHTRCTVRADSLASIITHYHTLQSTYYSRSRQ